MVVVGGLIALKHHPGLGNAPLQAFAHQGEVLFGKLRDGIQGGQVSPGVVGPQQGPYAVVQVQVEALVGLDGVQVHAKPVFVCLILEGEAE